MAIYGGSVYDIGVGAGGQRPNPGDVFTVWTDAGLTVPAVLTTVTGTAIGNTVTVDASGYYGAFTPAEDVTLYVSDGAGGSTVLAPRTDNDLEVASPAVVASASTAAPARKKFHDVTLGIDFWADAPGKVRRRGSQFHVPESWATDAVSPAAFVAKVNAYLDRLYAYGYNRAGIPSSATATGLPARRIPFGMDLMWSNNIAWPVGLDHNAQASYRAMPTKRLALDIRAGLRMVGMGRGAELRGQFSGGGFTVGIPYKPFSELAYDRSTGALSQWVNGKQGGNTWDQRVLFAGGRGAAGTRQWDYVAPRAIITGDVSRGDDTFPVNFVDGIDHTNRSAMQALNPLIPTVDGIAVGDFGLFVIAMNPIDGHEPKRVVLTTVRAINGNSTMGYTTTGPGTLTFDFEAADDYPLSSMVWDFGINRKVYHLTTLAAGGFDNVVNHSFVKCDPRLVIQNDAGLYNFKIIGENPDCNGFQIGPSMGFEFENISGYAVGGAFAKFTHAQEFRGRELRYLGGDVAAGLSGNNGKVISCSTASGVVDDVYVSDPVGVVFQSESDGLLTINRATIENYNPARSATDAVFNAIGNAEITARDVTIMGRPTVLSTVGSDRVGRVVVDGDLRIMTATIGRTRTDHLAPGARVSLLTKITRGGTVASPAPENIDRLYDTLDSRRFTIQCDPGGTQSRNLPTGIIRALCITSPASFTGITSVKIQDNTDGAQIVLTGRTVTDGSGPTADDNGIDGTKLYSTQAAWTSADVDSFVTAVAANLDGTDFVTAILAVGTDSTGTYALLEDPLPTTWTAQTFTIGSQVVAGKSIWVVPVLTDTGGPAGWNLRHQTASSNTRLTVICDSTVDPTAEFGVYVEFFRPRDQRRTALTALGNDQKLTDNVDAYKRITRLKVGTQFNPPLWTANLAYTGPSMVVNGSDAYFAPNGAPARATFTASDWKLLS